VIAAAIASAVAAVLLWAGPPGSDTAAHVFQRQFLLQHGFGIWNNFWYAGRYTFVTYSLAYYPLAAVAGIRLLALISVAIAAYAFTTVAEHEWGDAARWASRAFAVVWAAAVLSGTFPSSPPPGLRSSPFVYCRRGAAAGRPWRSC